MMLIGQDYPINTLFKFFNVILTMVILTLIIIPWKNFKNIKKFQQVYLKDNILTVFEK